MTLTLIDDFVTPDRFGRYLFACKGNESAAFALYESNLLISKSFYPLLSMFEVALRNRLNTTLSNYFSNDAWLIGEKSKFMSHPSLAKKFIAKNQVEDAEKKLLQKNVNVRSQIITELPFSFWVRLFQADHFKLLKAEPLKSFHHMPKSTNRDTIHQLLKSVLDFRNRIYHNEPICFGVDSRTNETIIDLSMAQKVYESIYTLLFWMGGNTLQSWVENRLDIGTLIAESEKANQIIRHVGQGRLFTFLNR